MREDGEMGLIENDYTLATEARDLWSSKEIQVRKRKHQEQDANQPWAKCLYASYCDQCVAAQFACIGGPETPKLKVYCAGLEGNISVFITHFGS